MNRAELATAIDNRNAAASQVKWLGCPARSDRVTEDAVVGFLRKVKAARHVSNETLAASFCGAAGLVTIRGRHTELTPAGRSLLH